MKFWRWRAERMNDEKKEEIREKLLEEGLTSPEIERVLDIWEKERNDELELVPEEEVWEELGIEK
jgi:hypothetical protein